MTGAPLPGVNVHVYPSPFEFETRILRVTGTLVAESLVSRVLVVATAKKGLPERERIDASREVLRVPTRIAGRGLVRKGLMFLEWSARTVRYLRDEPVTMVNCHSLSALPLCVFLKWRHRAILVYEPHELETETATSTGLRKLASKLVERSLIGAADGVIAVSESIAAAYGRDYSIPDVPAVLNVPPLRAAEAAPPDSNFRRRFGIPDSDLIFMFQGVLSESRGVNDLLDAFRRAPRDRHLVLMGFGRLETEVAAAAAEHANIHYHEPVAPAEVVRYTEGADVGFTLLSDDCLNHRLALPNKLFHYLHAGIPTIVSDLEEMGGLVDRYQCGWKVAAGSEAITGLVAGIDHEAIAVRRAGALRARAALNWNNEAEKMRVIYRNIFNRVSDRTNVD